VNFPDKVRQDYPSAENDQCQQLVEALERSGWNRTRAAAILGVSRVKVWKRMKKYGVTANSEIKADKRNIPRTKGWILQMIKRP
jgi:transcriptional regulator with GAF, ATPase, and Fis domain